MGTSPRELDMRQARMIEQTKQHLESAETFLGSGSNESVRTSLGQAVSTLRQLQRDHKIRRGKPRKELEVQIMYFSSW